MSDAIKLLIAQRRTKRMQATKARKEAEGYAAEADALTAGLHALGHVEDSCDQPDGGSGA